MIQGLGHRHALGGIFVQEPQNEIDCWAISTNAEVEKKGTYLAGSRFAAPTGTHQVVE